MQVLLGMQQSSLGPTFSHAPSSWPFFARQMGVPVGGNDSSKDSNDAILSSSAKGGQSGNQGGDSHNKRGEIAKTETAIANVSS